MTTFAERLDALPEWPVRLAGTSTAGLTFLRADALEARLRLAIELLEEVAQHEGRLLQAGAEWREVWLRPALLDDIRALVGKVKKELK